MTRCASFLVFLGGKRFIGWLTQCKQPPNVADCDASWEEHTRKPGSYESQVFLRTPSNPVVDKKVGHQGGHKCCEDAEAKATLCTVAQPPEAHRKKHQRQCGLPVALQLNFSTGLIDPHEERDALHDVRPVAGNCLLAKLVVQAWIQQPHRDCSCSTYGGDPPRRRHEDRSDEIALERREAVLYLKEVQHQAEENADAEEKRNPPHEASRSRHVCRW